MILSILICSVNDRKYELEKLIEDLSYQVRDTNSYNEVEILTEIDDRIKSTGQKRNELVKRASGEWVVHIDDDDEVSVEYLPLILEALNENPDVIGLEGCMTTNGKGRTHWKISKDLPYVAAVNARGVLEFHRFNNHLSPIRRSIALKIPFKNITQGEDYDYACRLKESGLIKTEVYIPKEIYHYKFKTK